MRIILEPVTWLKRYIVDKSNVEVELEEGGTISDCLKLSGIPEQEVGFCLLNGVRAGLDIRVSDGDLVKLFPTIIGG